MIYDYRGVMPKGFGIARMRRIQSDFLTQLEIQNIVNLITILVSLGSLRGAGKL